jgi:hypothetical protein
MLPEVVTGPIAVSLTPITPKRRTCASAPSEGYKEMLGISLGTAKTVDYGPTYLRASLALECLSEARETADLPIAAPEIRAVRVSSKANQCRFGLDELSPHPGRCQEE